MPRHAAAHRHNSPRNAPIPPLPHPSWQYGEASFTRHGHPIDASAFWQRLGL